METSLSSTGDAMYSKLPNLIIAFHGCDEQTFNAVVRNGESLKPSTNEYDWLGNGAYFWEQNYERGLSWAKEQQKRGALEKPAVIGAVIDLGYCLNLTDSRYIDLLRNEYELMKEEFNLLGIKMPENEGKTSDKLFRKLDCAVIEHLHASMADSENEPFDSVRGLFMEGRPIYEGSGFFAKTHVQICVRNPNCIKGYFDPRKPNRKYRIP